jgi:hypothetical protein
VSVAAPQQVEQGADGLPPHRRNAHQGMVQVVSGGGTEQGFEWPRGVTGRLGPGSVQTCRSSLRRNTIVCWSMTAPGRSTRVVPVGSSTRAAGPMRSAVVTFTTGLLRRGRRAGSGRRPSGAPGRWWAARARSTTRRTRCSRATTTRPLVMLTPCWVVRRRLRASEVADVRQLAANGARAGRRPTDISVFPPAVWPEGGAERNRSRNGVRAGHRFVRWVSA